MLEKYQAKYNDKFGEEIITIQNNGKLLRMAVRGVEFEGTSLDDWAPVDNSDPTRLSSFLLHPMFNTLYQYRLEFEVQVPVVIQDRILEGNLSIRLDLVGNGTDKAGGREELQLELVVDGHLFKSCGKHGWFEDELHEIIGALPEGMYIRSCFNCAFSDYSPAGFGLFGQMACFRNTKQEYLSLKGKAAYFELQDKIAEFVQETYLCSEFEKRLPGTGYRG